MGTGMRGGEKGGEEVTPYFSDPWTTLYHGNCLDVLRQLPDESVNCVMTSPPYWGLRDYGHTGQVGLEKSPEEYVGALIEIFREVRRVLKDDGSVWINIGDCYCANKNNNKNLDSSTLTTRADGTRKRDGLLKSRVGKNPLAGQAAADVGNAPHRRKLDGLKPKDLIGIPWRVAFALQADGWYLRSDIIWHKPNPMPESVRDRPTRAHEYIFLLTKGAKYFYDAEAIKEDGSGVNGGASFGKVSLDGPGSRRISAEDNARIRGTDKQRGHSRRHAGFNDRWDAMNRSEQIGGKVNKRDVWTVCPANYSEAHFATFPPKLIEPCVLAGCPDGGVILDPFNGAGTTGLVAKNHRRKYIGIELNKDYLRMTVSRLAQGILFAPVDAAMRANGGPR